MVSVLRTMDKRELKAADVGFVFRRFERDAQDFHGPDTLKGMSVAPNAMQVLITHNRVS